MRVLILSWPGLSRLTLLHFALLRLTLLQFWNFDISIWLSFFAKQKEFNTLRIRST